jgi:two-component system OmpR family sensor kinase
MWSDLARWVRRLPIRLRLTLMFAAVMAVLLAGLISFLYLHFRSDLDYNINQSLRARAQEVAGLVRDEDAADTRSALRTISPTSGNFVQVLDRSGAVLGTTAAGNEPSLLTAAELRATTRSARLIQRGNRSRFLALPIDGRRIVVAGVSLAERDAALDKLDDALAIGVPPALLLASLAAYALAAAALAPVERMRARAATISTDGISTRLPLPVSSDEIRRLGTTLNAMLDRLEAGLLHERLFVANASHELRMPLAVLRAELEVSLRERGSESQLRETIGSAIEETDRIIRLAEDLLLLARSEDGTLPMETQEIAVQALLAELAGRLAPVATHAGRPFVVCETVPAGTRVAVDPERIQQAMTNLLENAVRYGAGSIALGARQSGGSVELHITDEGPGLDPSFLPRAFDRFSRADPARTRGGVGLGRAIVRTIAQAHGGLADAGNRPEGGADVWVSVPAVAPVAPGRASDRVAT